jgi:hypothetical protein
MRVAGPVTSPRIAKQSLIRFGSMFYECDALERCPVMRQLHDRYRTGKAICVARR